MTLGGYLAFVVLFLCVYLLLTSERVSVSVLASDVLLSFVHLYPGSLFQSHDTLRDAIYLLVCFRILLSLIYALASIPFSSTSYFTQDLDHRGGPQGRAVEEYRRMVVAGNDFSQEHVWHRVGAFEYAP